MMGRWRRSLEAYSVARSTKANTSQVHGAVKDTPVDRILAEYITLKSATLPSNDGTKPVVSYTSSSSTLT
jgi:hypothetical protein